MVRLRQRGAQLVELLLHFHSKAVTGFQQRVWAALRTIPAGTTCSYRDLAAQVGAPLASRAVGRANATNPIPLFVPCHRVVRADGHLGGFAFGLECKRWLIEHESRSSAIALAIS
jgi:O-6-methylguanine DNA methyltransferase